MDGSFWKVRFLPSVPNSIQMSSQSRNNQLDFIKGASILCVILHHILIYSDASYAGPIQYSIGHAVPLFLIVTMILYYTKYDKDIDKKINFSRIAKAIILPFAIAQAIIIPLSLICGEDVKSVIITFGRGMGSYYIALYLQVILLAKSIFKMLKSNFWVGAIILLVLHVATEVVFNYIGFPQAIYRLLCTRYLFLYVIAYVLFNHEAFVKFKPVLVGG